jgi:NAD(P)-dependent dehydrogenase (short-subunit alcohol dehydrogenase family)
LEVCRQLAESGLTVVLGSHDEERGRAAAERISGHLVAHQLDVADEESVNRLASSIEEEFGHLDILVNAVNPGWVQTDMGGSAAPRPVEEGADSIVWAAMLPNNGPTGGFFRDRRPVPW